MPRSQSIFGFIVLITRLDKYYAGGKRRLQVFRLLLATSVTSTQLNARILALVLVQTSAAIAQSAAPSETAASDVIKACDLAAASMYDKQRPNDIPGVAYEALDPAVVIPACEAAARAAPQDLRMSVQLARGYRRAGRVTEALPLLQQAADMGNSLAATDLAQMYGKGEGVEIDLKKQLFYLDQAARTGFSIAEYNYGILYEKGNAVLPKDENLARQLVSLAAKDNCPPAMNKLGIMLEKGIGGNKDAVEAKYWYEKAAEAGDFSAMNNLGFFLQMGIGGKQDLIEARKWFEKSANGKNASGTNSLGVMFRDGLGGLHDTEQARRLFRQAIALGEKQHAAKNLEKLDQTNEATAQGAGQGETVQDAAPNTATNDVAPSAALRACDLAAASPYDKQRPNDIPGVANGAFSASLAIPACEAAIHAAPQDPRMLYQLARGYRSARRFAEALPLFLQAAQMGNASAATDLAGMYAKGQGVEVDLKQQLYYLDQAARSGFSVAENDYGYLYVYGNAVLPKDENLARQLFTLAANDNYPPAMTNLGLAFDKGVGGNKDDVEARYWYEKAAQAGDSNGMYLFGFALTFGRGGPKDQVEARKWFEKAANANNAEAMNNLGVMFEHGWGGTKDLEEARRLYRKAIALGNKDRAAKNLEKLNAANP